MSHLEFNTNLAAHPTRRQRLPSKLDLDEKLGIKNERPDISLLLSFFGKI